MIILLSPAKTLNFEPQSVTEISTEARFLDQSALLVDELKKYSAEKLMQLMSISQDLAVLNVDRFASWARPFPPAKSKQAVLAFNGDVYDGLNAETLNEEAMQYAQQHVRILSGLYGLLRPLDKILPYRLEMGCKLPTKLGKDLYAFWAEKIAVALQSDLTLLHENNQTIVNLASDEYFKSVKRYLADMPIKVIQPVFEDWSGGRYKVISFYAKKARGLMTRYAIEKQLQDVENLKDFSSGGYQFDESGSSEVYWVFKRRL